EENLHVDFLENKPIEKGAGPNWLFDINSLTNSMNYVPVVVRGTNSTNFSGTKEAAGQDVKKDVSFLRYIVLPNWFHETHLESSTSNAQDACNADDPESSGNSNPTATSTNPPADHMETLAVETPIPTVSSPVPTACLNDSPELSSDTRLISKRVTSQDDTPSLDNILTLANRFEDILGVTTNTDDTNGVKADLGNMETTITASLTLTFRIHKDHPKKPKKVSDALQDPSWGKTHWDKMICYYAKVHKFQTQQRKPLTKKQQREFYTSVLRNQAGWKAKHFKGMTLEEIKEKFDPVWKQIQDFIPIGSKEESERFKKKGLRLEQDSSKKLKTSEEVPEEKLKEIMELIPVEEVYVEALQVKHTIIDWKVHTEGQRSYWKIIRLGGSSASYQFFVDLLKHFDREDLNRLWALVKKPSTSGQLQAIKRWSFGWS
nr:hypothetical protein [Tanacetum cinerariifolium]